MACTFKFEEFTCLNSPHWSLRARPSQFPPCVPSPNTSSGPEHCGESHCAPTQESPARVSQGGQLGGRSLQGSWVQWPPLSWVPVSGREEQYKCSFACRYQTAKAVLQLVWKAVGAADASIYLRRPGHQHLDSLYTGCLYTGWVAQGHGTWL